MGGEISVKYDNEFKVKVAREAISTNNITATAKKYLVNPNSVRKWKIDYQEGRLGIIEMKNPIELSNVKDATMFKREVINLKKQLEIIQNDLKEAMTLIGEKDFYIKKLEESINK